MGKAYATRICQRNIPRICQRNIPRICQRHLNIFLEKLERGVETTHTPPIAKLTPMPKYMKIQKKSLQQRLLKMP